MANFINSPDAATKTEITNLTNKLQEAQQLQISKTNKTDSKQVAKLKKVSGEFESIFLGYMLKEMRKTVPDDSLFGKSQAKEIFNDMYDDAMAKELSKAGGIGLAAMIYNQLSKAPEFK